MSSPFRLEYVKVRSGDDTFLQDHDCTEDTPNYAKVSQSILQHDKVKIDYYYASAKEHGNLWPRQTFIHENEFL